MPLFLRPPPLPARCLGAQIARPRASARKVLHQRAVASRGRYVHALHGNAGFPVDCRGGSSASSSSVKSKSQIAATRWPRCLAGWPAAAFSQPARQRHGRRVAGDLRFRFDRAGGTGAATAIHRKTCIAVQCILRLHAFGSLPLAGAEPCGADALSHAIWAPRHRAGDGGGRRNSGIAGIVASSCRVAALKARH